MVGRRALGLLTAAALATAALPGQAACRLALVLAMDVSASVDSREYALMMRGTASALRAEPVRAAFFAGPPVAVAAILWAGAGEQALVADWTLIDGDPALLTLAARIEGFTRPPADDAADWSGRTAVGAALLAAARLLERSPPCDARTLDLAGDGENNDGPEPGPLRATVLPGVTINALAVAGDLPYDHFADEGGRLSAWFAGNVLQGPGAFVESALDYDDFERAMTRKLLRELLPQLLGAAPGATSPG